MEFWRLPLIILLYQVQYRASREVLESTLELLKFLIKDNKYVQTRAFDNFDFLIDIKGVEARLGEALLEVSSLLGYLLPSGSEQHEVLLFGSI